MNKSNPGNCLGTADNAMMVISCASGGTQEPRIRVDAANVVGLRSKGRRIRAGSGGTSQETVKRDKSGGAFGWNKRKKTGRKINITHRHFAADRQVLQERVAVAVGEVHS